MNQSWKHTTWTELDAERCVVLSQDVGEETKRLRGLRLRHPDLKRPRWFHVSRSGNLYSRYTGKAWEVQREADGYIVKGRIVGVQDYSEGYG